MKTLYYGLCRILLFLSIVYRVWDEQDEVVIRLYPTLAWEVAGIIWKE